MRAFTGQCVFLPVCLMNILFIHQNFPGQFKHLAPALAAAGHRCVALTLRVKKPVTWAGVEVLPYAVARSTGSRGHPWLIDLESKVIRGEACFRAVRSAMPIGQGCIFWGAFPIAILSACCRCRGCMSI